MLVGVALPHTQDYAEGEIILMSTGLSAKRLFQLAAVVMVVGVLGAFAWFNYAWSDQTNAINQFQRLPPRSGLPVEVKTAGTYTVWAGAACGGYCDIPPKSDFYELMVLGFEGPDGMIRPEPFKGNARYRVSGSRHGMAVWLVDFDQPGIYTLERQNQGVGSSVLMLGKGDGLSSSIMTGVKVIVGVSGVLAVTLFIVAFLQRRRVLNEMMARVHGV